VWQDVVFLLLQ